MKRTVRIIFIALMPVWFLSGGGVFGSEAATLAIVHLEGPVKHRGPRELAWGTLDESDTVASAEGDFLVGDGGALKLKAGETTSITLNEETAVSLSKGNQGDTIRVNHGSTKFDLETSRDTAERYSIQTPNGVIGLRGTSFGVAYERDGRSEVVVDTGRVRLSDGEQSRPLREGSYGRIGQSRQSGGGMLSVRDTVPERYKLTWHHWQKRRRISELRRRRRKLESYRHLLKQRLESPANSDPETTRDRLGRVKRRLETVELSIDRVAESYRDIQSRYRSYRKRLEKKRHDFIRRRRQALEQFRRRRLEEKQKLKERREQGIEEMRRRYR